MKKLLILGSFVAIFLASCGEASNSKKCDASELVSAATCLCDLYNQLDNSDHLSDAEYDALNDEIDKFNDAIDKAIDEGKYTNDQLMAEGDKMDCIL